MSGYDGCAPMATPRSLATRTLLRIVAASPAWNPQATFADDTMWSSSESSAVRYSPKPSPRSALRSIVTNKSTPACYLRRLLPLTGRASTTSQSCSSSSKPPRETFGNSCSRTTTGVSQYVYPSSASTGVHANLVRTRSSPILPLASPLLFHFTRLSSLLLLDAIFETLDARLLGAARAAIESSVALHPVADDLAAAVGA